MSLSFPISPAVGATYNQFKWDGTAWQPNYAANFVTSINNKSGALMPKDVVGPGNRVLLVSSALDYGQPGIAAVDLMYNFDSTYDDYEVRLINIRQDSSGAAIYMQVWTAAGLITSATYGGAYMIGAGNAASGGDAYTNLGNGYVTLNSNASTFVLSHVSGSFAMPWDGNSAKVFRFDAGYQSSYGYLQVSATTVFQFGDQGALRGLRFSAIPGNFISIGAYLYGIVK